MDVSHVAKLANLPLTAADQKKLQRQFEDTLKTVDQISRLNTTGVTPTAQVTGLINVLREDKIDPDRILSQTLALSQAQRTHNGYFVAPYVFEQ